MAVDNFYAAMPLLVDRLRDQLPDEASGGPRTIDATDLLSDVENITKYCPAVFVMPLPMEATDSSIESGLVVDRQEYQVLVCVAKIKDAANVASIDLAAGKIMLQVLRALAGYNGLPQGFREVEYTGRGAPYSAISK